MKFTCEKYLLQGCVSTASRAAAAKSAVPALEGLLIEAGNALKISGFDLKTGITTAMAADVAEPGQIVLNAKLFGDIIRKLPEDIVSVEADENCATVIRCGNSVFHIIGMPGSEYPELPSVDGATNLFIEEKTLGEMIRQTNFAVSTNEARPIHTGALFEAEEGILTVVAVDGYRLALRREALHDFTGPKLSFVVPGTALAEAEKIAGDKDDLVRITPGAKHIMFKIGDTVLISRRLEGEFLNYRNTLPKSYKYTVLAGRKDLIDVVERVSLIISEKLRTPVRCVFQDGLFAVSANTALGKARDECPVEGDGEGLEIGFNDRYLLEALRAAPGDKIRLQLTSGIAPCVIEPTDDSGSFLYMILPVRLKANEG